MGNVYLVADLEIGQECALKVLPENSPVPQSTIAREFEALRQLDHPGVVKVHSLHRTYYTMEYVDGKRLSHYIGGELTQSLDLAVDICSALAYIHSCGTIHRDLKPDNILVVNENQVKIMDFGLALARVRRGEPIAGTVQYMAPELLKGFEIDPRADLYSVGIILYQLVTRRLPFESADLMSTVMDHIRTPPPPPRSFNRRLPEEFEQVILRAIAKNPMERYQTAEEFRADLVMLGGRSEIQKMRVEKGASILMKPAFIGRLEEMEQLEHAYTQVCENQKLGITLVTGNQGLGASHLLTEFAGAHLSQEHLIVEVDLKGKQDGPLGSLSSVVASTARQLNGLQPEVAKRLFDEWGPLLVTAAPQLADQGLAKANELELTPDEMRERLLTFFAQVAGQIPLALFLHSLERTPQPLADFLVQFIEAGLDTPLWLCATLQRDHSGEIPPGPWQSITDCKLPDSTRTQLELTPLTDEELTRMLSSMIGNKPLDDKNLGPIIQMCHGRPLLGVEFFRALAEDGQIYRRGSIWQLEINDLTRIPLPALLSESLLEQLPELSAAAQHLLSIISLADGRLSVEVCAELIGQKKKKLQATSDELESAGFLLRNPSHQGRLELPFERVREYLRAEIPQVTKVQWHGLLAQQMEKMLDSRARDLRMIAEHYRRAGKFDKAIAFYTRAGEVAKKYLDTDEAIDHYDQARNLAQKEESQEALAKTLGQLASLYSRKGRYDKAVQLYSQALTHPSPKPDHLFYSKGLAYAYYRMRQLEQAMGIYEGLLVDAPEEADPYYYLGMIHMATGDIEVAEELLRKGVETATRVKTDRDKAALYLQLGRLKFQQGLFHNAINYYTRAQDLLEGEGHEHLKSRISSSIALFHLYRGESGLAYKHLEDALFLGQACGDQARANSARILIGMCFELRSDLRRAMAIYLDCLESAQRQNQQPEIAKALLALGRTLIRQSEPERALTHLTQALKLFRKTRHMWGEGQSYFHLGEARLLLGQTNKARSSLGKAERLLKKVPMRWMLPRVYCRVVELLLSVGESEKALKTLNKSLKKARDMHDKVSEGLIYHQYALYCEQHDLQAEAREHFVASKTVLDQNGSPLEAARVYLDYGRYLLTMEKGGQIGFLKSALKHITAARDTFERAWVQPLCHKANLLLEDCKRTRFSSGYDLDPRKVVLTKQLSALRNAARTQLEQLRQAFEKELSKDMDGKALLARYEKRLKEVEDSLSKKISEQKKKNERLAKQLDEMKRERKNLLTLQEINSEISSTLDSSKLLEMILDRALEAVKAERGFLMLESKSGEPEVKVARNLEQEQIEDPKSWLSASIVQKAMRTGEPVLTSDAQTDGRFEAESIQELQLKSIMCVPLKWKTKIIGALYVDNRSVSDLFSERDLDFMITFANQAALALENALLYEELQKKEQLEQELNIANRIQQQLLPKTQPRLPGLEVHGMMQPARMVGGDYYDFIEKDGSLTVCIGDVSGKGVPAGLVMVMAQLFLHHWDIDPADTRDTMLTANKILHANTEPFVFMSMLLLNWNAETRTLRYTGAGHENILVYRAKKKKVDVIPAGGVVLGIKKDISAVLDEKELDLAPDDAVLLYTDGATEALNAKGEMYTLQRLRAAFAECGKGTADGMVAQIFSELTSFIGESTEQHDDITLAVLKCTKD